jgi:hypothetical protein
VPAGRDIRTNGKKPQPGPPGLARIAGHEHAGLHRLGLILTAAAARLLATTPARHHWGRPPGA